MGWKFWKSKAGKGGIVLTADDRLASLELRRTKRDQKAVQDQIELARQRLDLRRSELELEKAEQKLHEYDEDDEDDEDDEPEDEMSQLMKFLEMLGNKNPNSNFQNSSMPATGAAGLAPPAAPPHGLGAEVSKYAGQLHLALKFPRQTQQFLAQNMNEKQRSQLVDDLSRLQELALEVDEKYEDKSYE